MQAPQSLIFNGELVRPGPVHPPSSDALRAPDRAHPVRCRA